MDVQTLEQTRVAVETGSTWTIDPAHSTIGFSIKHMVFATVHGRFDRFAGTIRFDGSGLADATVEVQIDASSIDTGITKRDNHLRSADFFDIATFPTISFRGTRFEPINPVRRDRWLLVGDLTLHGVTRSVELVVDQASGQNLWDVEVAAFKATTHISRKDFGIGLNLPLESGEVVIGDDVRITIDVQVSESPFGGN